MSKIPVQKNPWFIKREIALKTNLKKRKKSKETIKKK